MNKINKFMKIIFLFLIVGLCTFVPKVKAYDLVDLDDYGVYCGYMDTSNQFYFFIVKVDYGSKTWEFDNNFDELGIAIEAGRPMDAISMEDQASIDWFADKGILTIPSGQSSYHWVCPSEPFGAKGLSLKEQGCHDKNCSTEIIPSASELNKSYTCKYTSSTSNDSLQIDYSYDENKGHTWNVLYPDNTSKVFYNTQTNANFMPSSSCEDIYYTKSDKRINIAVYSNSGNATFSKLCGSYKESEIEHFCSGNCNYADMKCPTSNSSSGSTKGCPSELKPIIKFLKIVVFKTVQLFVPILLIVMGTIDFVKAIASFDDKGNKEAISKFIRRCLSAVIIFFIVTIVTIVMDIFAKTDVGAKSDWKTCWQSIN